MAGNKNKTKNKAKNKVSIPVVQRKPVNQTGILKGLFSKVGIALDPELESKLNEEQDIQLSGLITTLNKSITENEKNQAELISQKQELEKDVTALETRKQHVMQEDKALTISRQAIEKKSTSLLHREGECANIEAQLIEREANAQAGFVRERQESLATMKQSFNELQQNLSALEQQKLKNDVDLISHQRQQATEFESQLQSKLSNEVEHLNTERRSFEKLQQKLKEDQIELNTAKHQFNEQLYSRSWPRSLNIKSSSLHNNSNYLIHIANEI
jgi:DNA repair exonuclease SbcCD ATPase subunit